MNEKIRIRGAHWVGGALAVLLVGGLALAQDQRRGVRRAPSERIVPTEGFGAAGPDVADRAPDLVLERAAGGKRALSEHWAGGPAVVVLGSYTSPEFRQSAGALQELARKYDGHATVVVIYTREAFPSDAEGPYGEAGTRTPEGVAQGRRLEPGDAAARMEAARMAAAELGLGEPLQLAVDGMDDRAWNAYGPAPHNAFVVDRHGYVVVRQAWFQAEVVDEVLGELLARERSRVPPAEATAPADGKDRE